MNTILISGTSKCVNDLVRYDVFIWGCEHSKDIQLIQPVTIIVSGYSQLWNEAKKVAETYFSNPHFQDGAYTQFLDHITMIY